MEELVELADGPTGCVKVAWGGCMLAWIFVVTISTVVRRRRRLDQT